MKSKLSPATLTRIREYIDSKEGSHVASFNIQGELLLSGDIVARHLRELVKLGLIAEAGNTRLRTYAKLAPVVEAQVIEQSAVYRAPPLKVDKHRSELYAELARARAAIPSIG